MKKNRLYLQHKNKCNMDIKFNEMKKASSQETLVRILQKFKYYFVSISEYDNKYFHCIIKCPDNPPMFSWLRFKKKKEYFVDYPLGLSVCSCYKEPFNEPVVFTREDVLNIIRDVPENYIGDDTL